MKYSQLQAFKKHLDGASTIQFSPLYLILLKGSFERKQVVKEIVELLKKQKGISSIRQFQGGNVILSDLRQELESSSLWGEESIIVIEEVEELSKGITEKLEPYLHNPRKGSYLILAGSTLNKATRFYKACEKAGVLLEIAEEKPWEKEKSQLEEIVAFFSKNGRMISPQSAQFLLKQSGGDLASLYQEMEKLLSFIGEKREVTPKEIVAICTNASQYTLWQWSEAVLFKDVAGALRMLKELMRDPSDFFPLIKGMRKQFQTCYHVGSLLSNGGTAQDVLHVYPYMKGNLLEKTWKQVQSYRLEGLKRGLLLIDEAEFQAKSQSPNLELLMEKLVVRACFQIEAASGLT